MTTAALFCAINAFAADAFAAKKSTTTTTTTTGTPAPAPDLVPYTANYTASMSGFPVTADVQRTLVQNRDNSWTLSFNAKILVFTLKAKSRFQYDGGQIQPSAYKMRVNAFGSRDSAELIFDRAKKIISSREKKKRWQLDLQKADLDYVSAQQQLQMDAIKGLKAFNYHIIDEDERDNVQFRLEGEEIIKTPVGSLNTTRLKLVRDDDKRQTWLWLAKDWHDLPVQMKQVEKDKEYRIILDTAVFGNKTIQGLQRKGLKKTVSEAKR